MPDPKPRRDRPTPPREAVFGTRGSSSTRDWDAFETRVEMTRRLLGLKTEEAHARRLDAAATQAEAKAEEASHRAAAEPERQSVSLLERTFRMAVEALKHGVLALLVLILAGTQIAGFIISPWFFSLNLLIAVLGLWARHVVTKEPQGPQTPERDKDP